VFSEIIKYLYSLFIITIFSSTLNAIEQIHTKDWTKQFGSDKNDVVLAIAIDLSGNILVAGNTNGVIGSSSIGSQDVFLRKITPEGVSVWTRQYGSIDYDNLHSIKIDRFNNIYLLGETRGVLSSNSNASSGKIFLIKLDTNGNYKWSKQYSDSAVALDLALSTDAIYLAGKARNLNATDDIFIFKLDYEGNEVWNKQYNTSDYQSAKKIVVNSVYNRFEVVGEKFANDGNSSYDVLYNSYYESGTIANEIVFGTDAVDIATSMVNDSKGDTYIAGFTLGSFTSFSNKGKSDAFIAKYSSNKQTWLQQFGTSEDDIIRAMAMDSSDNLYVVGTTDGVLVDGSALGKTDLFISKFTSDGTNVWHKQYGSTLTDIATSLTRNSNDDLYIGGYTDGELYGNSSFGLQDAVLVKMKKDGDAPVAKIVVHQSDSLQKSISFSSKSITNDENTVQYLWDFGDGAKAVSKDVTHTYSSKGTYTVSLTVTNKGVSDTKSVKVTIGNSTPVAYNQTLEVDHNVSFLLHGVDNDDDNLTFTITEYPQHGNITVSGSRYLYKIIDINFAGTDSLKYQVNDAEFDSNIATVTFNIIAANRKPSLSITSSKRSAQPAELIDFNATASDKDGTISSYTWDFGDGTTVSDANTTHKFDSDGSYKVSCTIVDNGGSTVKEQITIHIATNNVPTAEDISDLKVLQNGSLKIVLQGKDVDGTALTYAIVGEPSHGNVTVSSNVASYNAYFYEGNDSFTYNVTDGNKTSNIATVSIDIEVPPIRPSKDTIYFNQLNSCDSNDINLSGGTAPFSWSAKLGTFSYANEQNSSVVYIPHTLLKLDDTLTIRDSSKSVHTHTIRAKYVDAITVTPDVARIPNDTSSSFRVVCATLPISVTTLTGSGEFTINGDELNISVSEYETKLSFKVTDASGASVTKQLEIVDEREVDVALTIREGWNLLAIPVQKNLDASEFSLLGKFQSIWLYDENAQWQQEPASLKYGEGFWLETNETLRAVNFKGKKYYPIVDNLASQRWLLLGTGTDIIDIKTKHNFSSVWTYEKGSWVENPNLIKAGSGFWVLK